MVSYCSGKYARSMCDRCGWDIDYKSRIREKSGVYVCAECYDGIFQAVGNPLDKPLFFGPESVLKDARPTDEMETSIAQVSGWGNI